MAEVKLVRKIDNLGRVVVPKGIYKYFGIVAGDEVVISASDEGILINKHEKSDIIADISSVIRKHESDGYNFEIVKALEKIVKEQQK